MNRTWNTLLVISLVAAGLTGCQAETPVTAPPTETTGADLVYLTANVDPHGAGSLDSPVSMFIPGAVAKVGVTANPGYAFDHWSGDASYDTPEIEIVMDADKTVTAHFTRISYVESFELDEKLFSASHGGNILMDFDLDGDLDLIMTQFDWPPPQDATPILAYRNDGKGGFSKATQEVFAGYDPEAISVGSLLIADFNRDGLDDLFLAEGGQDHEPFGGGQSQIFIQNGQGQLINETFERLPVRMAFTHSAAVGDIDKDGDVDIYLDNIGGETQIGPRFLINDGQGFFVEDTDRIPQKISQMDRQFAVAVILDVDKDGDNDMVLGGAITPSERDAILLNDGSGHFTYAPETSMPPRYGGPGFSTIKMVSSDFNQDGWPDLVMSVTLGYHVDSNLQLLVNNGDGTYRDETSFIEQDWKVNRNTAGCNANTDGWLSAVYVVDANNDTWPDILAQGDSCLDSILFLNDEGQRFAPTENYSQFQIGGNAPWSLLPGDLDQDGNMDVLMLFTSMTQMINFRIPSLEKQAADIPPPGSQKTEVPAANGTFQLFYEDPFDGEPLQDGWELISTGDQPGTLSFSNNPGYLRMNTTVGSYDRLLRNLPDGEFEITTHILFIPNSDTQREGLMVWQDADNYVYISRSMCTQEMNYGVCVAFNKRLGGSIGFSQFITKVDAVDGIYLKITRIGKSMTAYYSLDGMDWVEIGSHSADFSSRKAGVLIANSYGSKSADFDYFQIYILK